jgi:predicted nuclease of predicted toxin-antitoxin system
VRLLFDQPLSRHLVGRLADVHPDSVHVATVGLDTATDREIWDYAGRQIMSASSSKAAARRSCRQQASRPSS